MTERLREEPLLDASSAIRSGIKSAANCDDNQCDRDRRRPRPPLDIPEPPAFRFQPIHLAWFLGAVLGLGSASAADWPQFLGPQRNGISPETGLVQTWPAKGPRSWRAGAGNAWAVRTRVCWSGRASH